MIVQATNTGGDLAQGQFDLAIPGGGVGICMFNECDLSGGDLLILPFLVNGCTDEWGAPSGKLFPFSSSLSSVLT